MSTPRSEHTATIMLAGVIVIGLAVSIGLVRWLDAHRPPPDIAVEDERLYLTDKTARRLSLGFNGLAADWYWMRSLQYVGRKIMRVPENVEIDNLNELNLKLLPTLLDTATTLDPQFMQPYEYAAIVLPAVNVEEAIRITRKGIDANPNAWRLYQHLGYIYWQQHNFQAAKETYGQGAKLPGAPPWMEAMSARMAAEGGSRETARQLYLRMYEQSDDKKVRDMARHRLMQLDSLDQRDVLARILNAYRTRAGHCPTSWGDIEAALRAFRFTVDAVGAPLDPAGIPYLLRPDCLAELDSKSEVPRK